MRKIIVSNLLTLFCLACCFIGNAQKAEERTKPKLEYDKNKPEYTVDASCGTCQFHMPGKSCELAIKFEGKYYYVSGTKIDDHGDAHEKDGFCNAVRKAKVQGSVVDNMFVVTYFKLLKEKDSK